MKKLKRIDDAMIGITLRALENGIPLNDDVYIDMLNTYPHYQVKLENRRKTIENLKKKLTLVDSNYVAPKKYKF